MVTTIQSGLSCSSGLQVRLALVDPACIVESLAEAEVEQFVIPAAS